MTELVKQCKACGQFLPLSDFWKAKGAKDGLRRECKTCASAYTRDWKLKNKERISEYNKIYAEQNKEIIAARVSKNYWSDPEKYRSASRAAYWSNPERYKRVAAEYRKSNPDKVARAARNWRKNYPEKPRALNQRRRVIKLSVSNFYISAAEIEKIYSSPCLYCGSGHNITMDHVLPLSRGGWHSIGNLVPACSSCNSSKGSKTIMEWRISKMRLAGGQN